MSTVVVLGGGITGLSCAYYLRKLGKDLIKKVILLEQRTTLGGWIQSTRFPDGTVYEHGPKSIRIAGKAGQNTLQMLEELELTSEVLPVTSSHVATKRRLIFAKNKLHVLPSSMGSTFKRQDPFSNAIAWYVAKCLITKRKLQEDESVHDFAERRFGKEVAQYMMDPMCRGVSAGSSRELSIRSFLNVLYKAEQEHFHVMMGYIKLSKEAKVLDPSLSSGLNDISQRDHWSIWSLKSGLQLLPDSLATVLTKDEQVQLSINTACKKVHFVNGKTTVDTAQYTLECDHIFSCLPARTLSRLVCSDSLDLAKELSAIPSVHVAVVNLEYKGHILHEQGFGYLVPSTEDSKILGTIFDSCCFPEHDGHYADKTRLTVMMGGYWFHTLFGDVLTVNPETLLQVAVHSIAQQLNITADPIRYDVSIQKHCIPQYNVGHHGILERVKKEISEKQLRLSLLGASYQGISVNDCIYNSRLEVENYLNLLQHN